MRLFEVEQKFGGLPEKAGVAILDWNGGSRPSRAGKKISIPNLDEVQFFPLLDGVQFLVQVPARESVSLYFGGTDEQPFLVELEPAMVKTLRGGEVGFFDALKPRGAKALEDVTGTTAVRQGDWFAVPIPLTWKAAAGMVALVVGGDVSITEPNIKKDKKVQLGGTRHDLIAERHIDMWRQNPLDCKLVGEGVLKAPDHEDLVLEGPHAFFQTAHLLRPTEAD